MSDVMPKDNRNLMFNSGGRGLGYNMTQALCEVGIAGVAIFDVQQDLGDQAAKDLSEQTGIDCRFYKVDVRDGQAIAGAVQDVASHFGRVDVLISAAGIAEYVSLLLHVSHMLTFSAPTSRLSTTTTKSSVVFSTSTSLALSSSPKLSAVT